MKEVSECHREIIRDGDELSLNISEYVHIRVTVDDITLGSIKKIDFLEDGLFVLNYKNGDSIKILCKKKGGSYIDYDGAIYCAFRGKIIDME